MAEDPAAASRTVLNEWHRTHGGRMVDFGGWDMPVQYPTGIIGEHLATRRHAGLFDVSHMGRFRLRGPAAESFLLEVLTNDAAALAPGEAQYTILANEAGGAIDDAYLYRLDTDDFLLVVNAANRARDWDWLRPLADRPHLAFEDESEAVAMIALQGPESANLLEAVVGRGRLPPAKRNRLAFADFDGRRLLVARTGYTGEPVCFELFPAREHAIALWERLVAGGAVPVGLGARDSLRLEAGLPLYGHELGQDPEGGEIPVFAIDLARFAVRGRADRDYIGRAALERQRAAFLRNRRGEPAEEGDLEVLPRIVRPIAALASRRPLRSGQRVHHEGRPVGWVTSGTSVPYDRSGAGGCGALPGKDHVLRPIGLALVEAPLRHRADPPLVLEVHDARGNTTEVEITRSNLA